MAYFIFEPEGCAVIAAVVVVGGSAVGEGAVGGCAAVVGGVGAVVVGAEEGVSAGS